MKMAILILKEIFTSRFILVWVLILILLVLTKTRKESWKFLNFCKNYRINIPNRFPAALFRTAKPESAVNPTLKTSTSKMSSSESSKKDRRNRGLEIIRTLFMLKKIVFYSNKDI